MTADQLHEKLTGLGDESAVMHHPMCGAHPVLDDGPCACPSGIVAGLIRAIVGIHNPRPSSSINSLSCGKHNPNLTTHRAWADMRPEDFKACPDCVVTPITVCSCWDCEGYPCETVRAVAGVLGLSTVAE